MSVTGLEKSYHGTPVVSGFDLRVDRGEIFALLGPNGAGKTTVVEILEGHRTRDAGEVRVLGTDPHRAGSRWRARIGIVAQQDSAFPDLTVRETLRHFAGYYPSPRDPDEVLEAVGLAERGGARVPDLSGGQRRRLSVALGIIGDPELLFLDEPTTGFDPEARRRFWALIKKLSAGGMTILLTTHYLDEAEYLADRIGLIVAGRMRDVGPPSSVGGRDTDRTLVAWDTPEGRRERETATPTATVLELAERYDGEVPGLSVRRPTLEDVYLRLIGEHQ
ncbi:ABC transporter ATP-binding protein [Streptomyces calidiresistens]